MCGRYALTSSADILTELFRLVGSLSIEPRWNIAPTQSAPIIRAGDGGPVASMMHWGLVPFWAKDVSIGSRMINARSETAAEKPSFRQAFRARRCLVPADAFYEWKKIGKAKQPFAARPTSRRPWAFGGLWEQWRDPDVADEAAPDAWRRTFTILTTSANEKCNDIHPRMPVIFPPEHFEQWLDPDEDDVARLTALCQPAPVEGIDLYPVSQLVNRVVNDDASLLDPVPMIEIDDDPEDSEPMLF